MNTSVDTDLLQNIGVGSKPARKPNDKLGQEAFLKLMTAQLQNQDPFKPMDNGEFLSQIAQFGTVSGINDLRDSFKDFSNSIVPTQSLQAAGLINRNVLVASENLTLDANGMKGAIELPDRAAQVKVSVYGAGGQLVHSFNLGAMAQGINRYQWDGSLPDGSKVPTGRYKVSVDALVNGKSIAIKNYASAPVESITFGGTGNEVNVNIRGQGSRTFSEILQIS
ncbi:MAG TPA: flagellar hook assembly protein FlgD [Gammaproteobacteria bacterium]|nr:flagellar hook assembly protein FlgD [Gammaproteobacteria bacterium]